MSENRAAKLFWHLQDIYTELKPCRFAFVVAIIGAIVFLGVEQGREVLRALAEPGALTGVTGALRLVMFGAGLVIWSLVSAAPGTAARLHHRAGLEEDGLSHMNG